MKKSVLKETGQSDQELTPVFCVHGFKAFNKNMTCRGFQFKEGETYEHSGPLKVCGSGFHFCENPLDVLDFYNLLR